MSKNVLFDKKFPFFRRQCKIKDLKDLTDIHSKNLHTFVKSENNSPQNKIKGTFPITVEQTQKGDKYWKMMWKWCPEVVTTFHRYQRWTQ